RSRSSLVMTAGGPGSGQLLVPELGTALMKRRSRSSLVITAGGPESELGLVFVSGLMRPVAC
ncbi:MAG: hypothetical protein ABGW98_06035, partial [Myxococcales bacterium]